MDWMFKIELFWYYFSCCIGGSVLGAGMFGSGNMALEGWQMLGPIWLWIGATVVSILLALISPE